LQEWYCRKQGLIKEHEKQAKEMVGKAMRREAEPQLHKLGEKPKNVLDLLKLMEKEGKDIEGGRYMRWEAKLTI